MNSSRILALTLLFALGASSCSAQDEGAPSGTDNPFDDQTLYRMGYALKHISPVTPELSDLSLKALRASADMGNGEAMVQIGEMYLAGRVPPEEGVDPVAEAVNWWEKAWENGATRAYHNIGLMYYHVAVPGTGGNGSDVFELDYDKGFKYFKAASDRGDFKAQRFVGHSYRYGWGVEQDYAEAARYYRMLGPVSIHLAELLLEGNGVEQDVDRAIEMFDQVASKESGGSHDRDAAETLAHLYEDGTYVEADQDKALHYYRLAANYGSDAAQARLAELGINCAVYNELITEANQ